MPFFLPVFYLIMVLMKASENFGKIIILDSIRAGCLRCQNSLWQTSPEMIHFQPGKDILKFTFSKMATKIDEILTVDLTLSSKCQFDGEDFLNFCGLLRKHKL